MNIEDLKYIINNKNHIKNVNIDILTKDNSSMLKSFLLIAGGLYEIFGIFLTVAFLFTNSGEIYFLSVLINFFCAYAVICFNKEPLLVSFFKVLQRRKILNSNVKKEDEIFNILMNHEYSHSQIEKILEYYNSLNGHEKEYFIKKTKIENYIFIKVIEYIKNNDIQSIQDNKEELTQLVFDSFNEEDINEILVTLKNKINNNKNQKLEFINTLNKNNKQIIKEI